MSNWESIGINIDGQKINNLCFAENIVIIAGNLNDTQTVLKFFSEVGLKNQLFKNPLYD